MSVVADHIVVGTTAAQLPDVECRRVTLVNKSVNDPVVWIGDSDVTAGVNGNGFPVGATPITLEEISNLSEVYAVASSETSMRYLAER